MSVLKRGPVYYIRLRLRDVPHLCLSTGSPNRALAGDMERSLLWCHRQGRADLLGLLKAGRLTLRQLHEAVVRGPSAVAQLEARAESPELGPLVDEWLAWLANPSTVSPRTKRPYSPGTALRYRVSWTAFFDVLPKGRASRVSDINRGFIADFKKTRVRFDSGGGYQRRTRPDDPLAIGTVNRDLAALGCFLTWCQEHKGLAVVRPKLGLAREPKGRERWLSADELRALEAAFGASWPEWWPFFATLAFTGLRYGEAAGLRAADVRLAEGRISVNEADRRLKTASSSRDVPIPEPLAAVLAAQLHGTRPGPADLVFGALLGLSGSDGWHAGRQAYHRAAHVFARACIAAGIHHGKAGEERAPRPTVTIHDLRHTFGVHAAQAGVPIVRLQKLLGHETPEMTLRYMKHAPEAYFAEDAARVAASLTGTADAETDARAALLRKGLKSA